MFGISPRFSGNKVSALKTLPVFPVVMEYKSGRVRLTGFRIAGEDETMCRPARPGGHPRARIF